jgi:hypothetical protein
MKTAFVPYDGVTPLDFAGAYYPPRPGMINETGSSR